MTCNSKLKNAHYKSAQNAYNNTAQTFVAAGTPINVLGILNTDSGCSIDAVTVGTPEFYACMAKAFLFDKDAKSPNAKMTAYYFGIVDVE